MIEWPNRRPVTGRGPTLPRKIRRQRPALHFASLRGGAGVLRLSSSFSAPNGTGRLDTACALAMCDRPVAHYTCRLRAFRCNPTTSLMSASSRSIPHAWFARRSRLRSVFGCTCNDAAAAATSPPAPSPRAPRRRSADRTVSASERDRSSWLTIDLAAHAGHDARRRRCSTADEVGERTQQGVLLGMRRDVNDIVDARADRQRSERVEMHAYGT